MPLNRWLEAVSDHIASERPGTDTHSDAGTDDRQLYRLTTAMGCRTLVPAPHPVPTRHVRAITGAARQRGLHQRNAALMEQALTAPETVANLISRA